MATRRPPRGIPEAADVIRVLPTVRPSLVSRARGTIGRTLKLLLLLAIFGYIGVSVYMAASLGAAPRDVPQVQGQVGSHYEDVTFATRTDHLLLKGWLFHADRPTGRSVIFTAGWKTTRVNALDVPVGHDLLAHGYDVLMYDGRGTGQSEGSRQTLGNLEQRDVLGAHDYMKSRGYAPGRMVLYGISAGAAATLLASPDLPDVGAVVSDSAFAELRPLIDQGWTDATHLPGVTDWLGVQVGRFLDVDADLSPAGAVSRDRTRAYLFFHAQGDGLIPVSNAEELKRASANPQTQLVIVAAGTAHMDTYAEGKAAYLAALYGFLDQQIAAHGG